MLPDDQPGRDAKDDSGEQKRMPMDLGVPNQLDYEVDNAAHLNALSA
jgi:hypothetical protein